MNKKFSKEIILRCIATMICLVQIVSSKSFASEEKKYPVDKIILNGNAHLPDDSVLYYLGLSTGNEYSTAEINQKVKKAYDTGFFKKISVDHSDFKNIMIVNVVEQPVISSVKLYGNHKINDKDIQSNLKLKAGMTFSEKKMKRDVEMILKLYQFRGHFSTIVNPKIIEETGGAINIAFEIKEGKKSVIEKIIFVGNKNFPSNELQQNILSSEWAFYKIFANSYNYDQERFQIDAELINEYYQSRGYPNGKVVNTVSEIDASSKAFILTFFIDEGEKFDFGKVTLEDKIKISDNKEILNSLKEIKSGDLFNINTIRSVVNKINTLLARKGYAFAKIDHTINENPKTKIVDITIKIEETSKFFINQINIINNTRTKDLVIRREMRVSEQDSYDISKIERSLQRIRNLGYFSQVQFTPKQISGSDKVDLEIEVEEKRTGTALFNVGYNTLLGGFIGINFSEGNFLGTGRNVSSSFNLGKVQKSMQLSLSEPYFMGFDVTSGVSIFLEKTTNKEKDLIDNNSQTKYNSNSKGIAFNTTYNLTEYLKHDIQYGLKLENISLGNNKMNISPYLRPDINRHIVSSIGHSLIYDKTDNITNSTKGYLISLYQGFAGLGGNSRYLQNIISGSNYTPIYKDKVIMKVSARGGVINGISKKVRISDNFNSGDSMIRGFEYNGIGARDQNTLQSLGGKNFISGSVEVKFPLGLPSEIGVNGVAFTDMATLYNIDVPDGVDPKTDKYFNSKKLRMSYGVGIVWNSPLGIMRFDYGIPISKTSFDKVQRFNFGIGKSF